MQCPTLRVSNHRCYLFSVTSAQTPQMDSERLEMHDHAERGHDQSLAPGHCDGLSIELLILIFSHASPVTAECDLGAG